MKRFLLAGHINLLPWNNRQLAEVKVGGTWVTLVRQPGDTIMAFSHKCPHAGAPMAGGWIEGEAEIVCPLHRFRFSLTNGRSSSGEGFHLQVYPITKKGDEWYIDLPGGWINW